MDVNHGGPAPVVLVARLVFAHVGAGVGRRRGIVSDALAVAGGVAHAPGVGVGALLHEVDVLQFARVATALLEFLQVVEGGARVAAVGSGDVHPEVFWGNDGFDAQLAAAVGGLVVGEDVHEGIARYGLGDFVVVDLGRVH